MSKPGRNKKDAARAILITDNPALPKADDVGGAVVSSHKDAGDLIEFAKREMPHVLVVDLTNPDLVRDFERAARVLSRCDATQSVQMIAVVPQGFTESWQNKIRASGAFDLVLHPILPGHLKRAVDRADARSTELLREQGDRIGRRISPTKPVPGNRSLLVRQIKCPQHDVPQPLPRYILRVGAIVTDVDFFDLPVYKSPTTGNDFVNYHLLNVMVCPRCLVASNDAAYFSDSASRSPAHNYNAATRQALRETLGKRQEIAGTLGDLFNTDLRSVDEAIISYELALQTSRVLYDMNRFTLQIELARMGNCHLRLAAIKASRPQGISNAERVAHYRAALDLLGEAFVVVDGPILFKVAYQVVALSIALGEDASAYRYIARLTTMAREGVMEKDDRAALDRYLLRCQQAWEDRERYHLDIEAEAA